MTEHDDSKEASVLIACIVSKSLTILVAVLAIGFMEWCALQKGIDGVMLTGAIGAVCLIVGVEAKEIVNVIKNRGK